MSSVLVSESYSPKIPRSTHLHEKKTTPKFNLDHCYKDYSASFSAKKKMHVSDDYSPSNEGRRWSKSPWTTKVRPVLCTLTCVRSLWVSCSLNLAGGWWTPLPCEKDGWQELGNDRTASCSSLWQAVPWTLAQSRKLICLHWLRETRTHLL